MRCGGASGARERSRDAVDVPGRASVATPWRGRATRAPDGPGTAAPDPRPPQPAKGATATAPTATSATTPAPPNPRTRARRRAAPARARSPSADRDGNSGAASREQDPQELFAAAPAALRHRPHRSAFAESTVAHLVLEVVEALLLRHTETSWARRVGGEPAAQRGERLRTLALHRPGAAAEQRRGLGLGHVEVVAQQHHRTLPRRQRPQRRAQHRPVLDRVERRAPADRLPSRLPPPHVQGAGPRAPRAPRRATSAATTTSRC